MSRILEGKSITKGYDGTKIIEDISIYVDKGEMVSLLGVSGTGKTTLFNIMSGLEEPDMGEVYLKGERITGKAGLVGYMQQSDLLLPFKTVMDNTVIPLRLNGLDKKAAYRQGEEILKEFMLDGYKDMYPACLSGGMRQRVALARTFLTGAEVMLFDEPFSALDAITRSDMQKWFKGVIRKKGIATLFITHDIDEAIILSDRIYIMGGATGQIKAEIVVETNQTDALSDDFIKLKKEILKMVK